MAKYKATKKFKALGTENSYQHLETEQYFAFHRGETVEMKVLPFRARFLLFEKYIERLPEIKQSTNTNKNVKGA